MLKAIIFDVGGVLIRTQSRTGRQKWADRLGLEAWNFENFVFSGESGRLAQLGQKTYEAHWQWLGRHFGLTEPELAEMRRDFFAGDLLNEALLGYIQRLGQAGFRLGLLSNFADDARQLWRETFPLIHYFDRVIISSEVGLMKPDPRVYRLALVSLEVRPEEALFVDDFIENVRGAEAVGLQALHFTDPEVAQRQLVKLTGVS